LRKIKPMMIIGILVALMLSGCVEAAREKEAGGNESATTSTNGEKIEWRMISTWGDGSVQLDLDKKFAETVNELSGGTINIKLHSVDQLAPANQVLDTVSNGTVEMGGDWPNYWSGKNTAFDLLGSHAVGFSIWDYFVWVNQAGGHDLYNEIYGQYNTVYFPHTFSGMESGIRSNKPINSLDDFKGMKIRMAGLIQSELTEKLGAIPTTIATHEIYESLQRGVIDAAEFSTPYADEIMKLHEVTDYWLSPGWHQTAAVYGVMINKDAWETLTDEQKQIFHRASEVTMTYNSSAYIYNDSEATKNMIDEYGIEVTTLSDSEMEHITELSEEILDRLANENPDFDKVLSSQKDYLELIAPYRDLQGEWGFGNNLMIHNK